MSVITKSGLIFYAETVSMFVTYLCATFHAPNSIDSLVLAIKLMTKEIFGHLPRCFMFGRSNMLTEVAYVSKILLPSFEAAKVSGAGVCILQRSACLPSC
jgi:hypothetical protein